MHGVPDGLVGGPRAYKNFVGSSLTECMLVRAFSCIKRLISGKRDSVNKLHSMKSTSSGTFDEIDERVGMLNAYARQKIKARAGGEKGCM